VLLLLAVVLLAQQGGAEDPWPQAIEPRSWSFPLDHGSHPEYRTEWWYFTGNLEDGSGTPYGYQLTIFRVGLRQQPAIPENPWSVRDLFLGHLAITDPGGVGFRYADRVSRAGPGLAGAATEGLDVWLWDWSARREDGTFRLQAATGEMALDLSLRPEKPPVIHGPGEVSRKGPRPGQASYYASITALETSGRIRAAPDGRWVPIRGVSWFDQEFGSNQLAEDQAGWDWFSLHLSDGRDLMAYLLRREDGSVEPASSGTLVAADGSARHLRLADLQVEVRERWRSERTGARYPSRWRLRTADGEIDLAFAPILADQELVTEGSTGVVYWEGAVQGGGLSAGQPVTCRGYVEMTGYAGSLGGLF
jgi:predicted secreted hydrolase